MQKITVTGHTTVVVSTVIEVPDGPLPPEEKIFKKAHKAFRGISAFFGNGGSDKLIGVQGSNDTIAADEEVVFDDFIPEGHSSPGIELDANEEE